MPERDRITEPSMGSNELGSETTERRGAGISAGTDTQTQMAAISAQRKKEEHEAIVKAKKNIDKAVTQKELPDDSNE